MKDVPSLSRSKMSRRTLRNRFFCPPRKRIRLSFLILCLCLWAVAVVVRLIVLQGKGHDEWLRMAERQHKTQREVLARRGDILDRHERRMAVSLETVDLGIHPRKVGNIEELAKQLEPIVHLSKEEVAERIKSRGRFFWLARGLDSLAKREILAIRSAAIELDGNFRRYYPHGSSAANVLGKVSRDGVGQSGVELSFDRLLGVEHEILDVTRDARGRLMHRGRNKAAMDREGTVYPTSFFQLLAPDAESPAADFSSPSIRSEGADVILSIDTVIQEILEEELERGQEVALARNTFGLIMDAANGEILAFGQSVRFDPNRAVDVTPEDLRNVALQNVFEPGSTFKPLVAAIGLEEEIVNSNEIIDCENGNYQVGSHLIRDVHPSGLADLNHIIVHSSNIGMAKIGQRIGSSRLHRYLRLLGFGAVTGVELIGEEKGLIRPVSSWKPIDLVTASFGQGVAVTALQMVRAYSALANGGTLVTPTIILDRTKEREKVVKRVFSPKTVEIVSSSLKGVVEDEQGTGGKAAIPGVPVYGKTGTAQKAQEGARGYDPNEVQSSFIGFVRGEEIGIRHTLVMLVVVDEPAVKPRWGGVVAAPIFQKVMSRVISHLVATESQSLPT